MSRILVAVIAAFGVASLSSCAGGIGKGKGKAPPPVVEPAPAPEPAPVYK
ncbi:ABC transporter [Mesorhizobium xinjiangense]|nr:ABC transporter [Mesorhizobium xinjiangense]